VVDKNKFHELIGGAYDAAADAARWPDFIGRCARAFDATTGMIQVRDARTGSTDCVATLGLGPHELAEYAEYYVHRDPWAAEGAKHPPGTALLLDEHVPVSVYLESEAWNDFARRVGPGIFHCVGGSVTLGSPAVGLVGLHRPRSSRPFERSDRAGLALLLPHLQRALEIRQKFAAIEQRDALAFGALEHLAIATLIVRADGKVVFANAAARRLAEARDGFVLGGERTGLAAGHAGETRALRQLIAEAAMATAGRGTAAGGALRLSRPSHKRPYVAMVSPLAPRWTSEPTALVLVSDPDEAPMVPRDVLVQLFGLTPAEARLALALGAGESLEDAAETFGVGLTTVRTQLRQVFAKTDTNRQADLVRLLARLDLRR
jgi:DNA-binding CsgD family transcriptional regulator